MKNNQNCASYLFKQENKEKHTFSLQQISAKHILQLLAKCIRETLQNQQKYSENWIILRKTEAAQFANYFASENLNEV